MEIDWNLGEQKFRKSKNTIICSTYPDQLSYAFRYSRSLNLFPDYDY